MQRGVQNRCVFRPCQKYVPFKAFLVLRPFGGTSQRVTLAPSWGAFLTPCRGHALTFLCRRVSLLNCPVASSGLLGVLLPRRRRLRRASRGRRQPPERRGMRRLSLLLRSFVSVVASSALRGRSCKLLSQASNGSTFNALPVPCKDRFSFFFLEHVSKV